MRNSTRRIKTIEEIRDGNMRIDRINFSVLNKHSEFVKLTYGIKTNIIAYMNEEMLAWDTPIIILGYITQELSIKIGAYGLIGNRLWQLIEHNNINITNLKQLKTKVIIENLDKSKTIINTNKTFTQSPDLKKMYSTIDNYEKLDTILDMMYEHLEPLANKMAQKKDIKKNKSYNTEFIGIDFYENKYTKISIVDDNKLKIEPMKEEVYKKYYYSNTTSLEGLIQRRILKTGREKLNKEKLYKVLGEENLGLKLIVLLKDFSIRKQIPVAELDILDLSKIGRLKYEVSFDTVKECLNELEKLSDCRFSIQDYLTSWINKSENVDNVTMFGNIKAFYFKTNEEMINQIKKDKDEILNSCIEELNNYIETPKTLNEYNLRLMRVLPDHTIMILLESKVKTSSKKKKEVLETV